MLINHDAGNQPVNSVLQSTGVGAAVLKHFAYAYDLDGNRTGEQIGTTTNAPISLSQSSYNNLNQATSRTTSGGQLQFAGSLDKQGTVTVNGVAAAMNHLTTNFVGYSSVTNGTNVIPLIATDYGDHSRTNNYQLVVTNNGVAETISYDLNGNETNVVTATSTNSYQWDALNRLVSVTSPTNQSLFAYDGLGRRVQIIEKTNGVAYVTNKFLWDGMAMAEQRDNTGGTVVKRFFGEGEQISGTSYFFTRDHLGSVREMTDNTGAIKARYDYDPYGRQTKLSGTMDADFGYAGMFVHWPSGLNLTLYRAYTADLGRWLSRDPLAEAAGLNLYVYVANNPINGVDPYGQFVTILAGALIGAIVGGVVAGITSGGNLRAIAGGALGGAVTGALIGTGLGIVAGAGLTAAGEVGATAAVGAVSNMSGNIVQQQVNGVLSGESWNQAATSINAGEVAFSGVTGAVFGAGMGLTDLGLMKAGMEMDDPTALAELTSMLEFSDAWLNPIFNNLADQGLDHLLFPCE